MCTDENEKLNKTKATGKMEKFSHSPSSFLIYLAHMCDRPNWIGCYISKIPRPNNKTPFVFVNINKIKQKKNCHPQKKINITISEYNNKNSNGREKGKEKKNKNNWKWNSSNSDYT